LWGEADNRFLKKQGDKLTHTNWLSIDKSIEL
jgi:hypothetical protein